MSRFISLSSTIRILSSRSRPDPVRVRRGCRSRRAVPTCSSSSSREAPSLRMTSTTWPFRRRRSSLREVLGGQHDDRNRPPLRPARARLAANSKPSISGIIRSSRIRPGRSLHRSSASRPFSASTTASRPSPASRASCSRVAASSSTTRTGPGGCARGTSCRICDQPVAVDRLGQVVGRRRARSRAPVVDHGQHDHRDVARASGRP